MSEQHQAISWYIITFNNISRIMQGIHTQNIFQNWIYKFHKTVPNELK